MVFLKLVLVAFHSKILAMLKNVLACFLRKR